MDKRVQTVHELHAGIANSLEQAGIEIPFPQRDININMPTDSAELQKLRDGIKPPEHPPERGKDGPG